MIEDKEKRLLPGDWAKKIKYDQLDNVPKEIEVEQSRGRFFDFPEEIKGHQFEDREFLVFYFDNKEDYETVLKFFEIPTNHTVSHPKLNTNKLVKLIKRTVKRGVEPNATN
ncbi:MAG: hypothetical protein BWX44_00063 [Spirochaetes bacterium ADurb.Bin001]|nr:MAG: hypothetical protein BWX44_00063 [Spirochaetes bacterium ADurb.Bin001]